MNNIQQILSDYSTQFNSRIKEYFPLSPNDEKRVIEAMFYSLNNGGKRMRPYLVFECANIFGINFDQSFKTALSIECLHTYSLIHDDLPCMDNDDLRRGKPTCHKQFDEATAVLAGDGLLTYAFELISDNPTLAKMLAQNAGAFKGMIAGQMLDIISEEKPATENVIKRIEKMKTGCLISYSCESGAILGNANQEQIQTLKNYARNIGQAFQISDDILDVEGDQTLVGKTLGKDASQGKVTFVSLYGIEKTKQIAKNLIEQAKSSLHIFGPKSDNLKKLADYIIERKY
jgi:farnesyl diphosphate synthase